MAFPDNNIVAAYRAIERIIQRDRDGHQPVVKS
jgi:hypothetical protein